MKFQDYKYERPNMEVLTQTFEEALIQFKEANSLNAQKAAMDTINKLRLDFDSMQSIASIRHSVNTKDEFYDKENDFFDEHSPMFQKLSNAFYEALVDAKYRKELENTYGDLLFKIADQSLKTFDEVILDDLKRENNLVSKYDKLIASAEIEFEGETRNLSQMAPFTQDKNREKRKAANEAVFKFFEEHETTLDEIYDDLVKVRTTIAKKLGYETFTELAYARLGRLDYNHEDVANYRKQVLDYIVPVASELVEKQGKRIGIKDMKSYDLALKFLSGNPTPKGTQETLVAEAKTMYEEMSKETDKFFNFMLDRNLMDLESKKGKQGGGYCTAIPNYDSPFIFANFNGTSHDVDVLTHEAGHAFQVYQSMHHEVPEYMWATLEASEIHSMSMEFFAWPWVNKFFKEDTTKYKFDHIASSLTFIPYGVAVDEFQHEVYANPDMTPQERKSTWRRIEKKYLPYKVYENDFLERGGFWFRQSHIFAVPFYYIDYTLAQVCAFQYWAWDQEDHEEAWQSYLNLCQTGGSKTFLGLLNMANLKNPFKDGTIGSVIPKLKAFLDSVDQNDL